MVGVDSAFVGMTDGGVGFPLSWDGVFFRVLGYGSMNSRVRGNCGFPLSRE